MILLFIKKYIYIIINLIGLIFLTLYFIPKDLENKSKLLKNHKITLGIIYYNGKAGKGNGIGIEYKFKTKNIEYRGSQFRIPYALEDKLLNMKFVVVYSPNDPKINEMLISKSAYGKYCYPYPDSLFWIQKYYQGTSFK